MKNILFGLGAVVAMAMISCGGEAPQHSWQFSTDRASGKAEKTSGSYTILSYNAGLAHGAVALAEQRLPKIVTALKKEPADVVCLQEVWTDDDAKAVRSGLSAIYPYSFRQRTEDDSKKSVECGLWGTFMLDRCVKSNCTKKGISAEECVLTACKERYDALDDKCKLCLAANTAGAWRCAFLGAKKFTSEGRNGLLLLSRRPIKNARYTAFDTALVKRGVISAEVDGNTIQCTHLSSDLDTVPYPKGRTFKSWTEEQAAQIEVIDALSEPGKCTVLLGDLNAGASGSGLDAELPTNFDGIAQLGFVEPWGSPRCTWCDDNPLAGSQKNKQLDHILMRDCAAAKFTYRRALDAPITLEADGNATQTRLSDHYGLSLTISE